MERLINTRYIGVHMMFDSRSGMYLCMDITRRVEVVKRGVENG